MRLKTILSGAVVSCATILGSSSQGFASSSIYADSEHDFITHPSAHEKLEAVWLLTLVLVLPICTQTG